MKGRIKIGAFVGQDFEYGRWPATKSGEDVNPNMEFEITKQPFGWSCVADGFGVLNGKGRYGRYGNGSIHVYDNDGIVFKGPYAEIGGNK